MITKRALLVKPRQFTIIEEDINPGPGQVLVKIAACGLCNWELNHWKGHLGTCPQTLGHEWTGEITALGEGVDSLKVGDWVTGLTTVLHGFSEYAVFDAAECEKYEAEIPRTHALGEPLKCIVTVLQAAAPAIGDCGVVFGCGPMGLWCIQGLAGNMLSALIAVDIDDDKLELAKKFGASHTINPKRESVEEKVKEITHGHMADFAIEGTGSPAVVNNALQILKQGRGRLILMSSYESEAAPFNLKLAMEKSIEVKVAHPGYSTNQMEDMRRAVAALNKGTFSMDHIITHVFPLQEIQKAFEALENKPAGYLKGIVIP